MAVAKDNFCEKNLIYAGEKRPVSGENGKFYDVVRVPFSSIKLMGLEKNQYFSVQGNDKEVDIYYEISAEKVEIAKNYDREARKSATNEAMLGRCPVPGKSGKLIRCRGKCSECKIEETTHRYDDLRNIKSLDETHEDAEGNEYSMYDLLADPDQDVEEIVVYNSAMKELYKILDSYDDDSRKLLLSGFVKESQRSILESMGLKQTTGRERANKIFKEVKKKMLGE